MQRSRMNNDERSFQETDNHYCGMNSGKGVDGKERGGIRLELDIVSKSLIPIRCLLGSRSEHRLHASCVRIQFQAVETLAPVFLVYFSSQLTQQSRLSLYICPLFTSKLE